MKIVQLEGITKEFGTQLANSNINLDLYSGEAHALLGENGAGKTTLMRILYGLYQPTSGRIIFRGRDVVFSSPKDALNLGIGMVHQHFMLIPTLSVAENIILGSISTQRLLLDLKSARERITKMSSEYGLAVDPDACIGDLSPGVQQRVEIIKALYNGAELLIFDEPTSVLTPQEANELFAIIKKMRDSGKSIVFISHKLDEIRQVSDRVTVLRSGKVVGTKLTSQTTANELAEMMVGRQIIPRLAKREIVHGSDALNINNVWVYSSKGHPLLKDISFSVVHGEILGVAGVAGNGQKELAEILTGLQKISKGSILIEGKNLSNRSPSDFIQARVGQIPENRDEQGLILEASIAENLFLGQYNTPQASRSIFFSQMTVDKNAEKLARQYDIRPPIPTLKVNSLSGGNRQKVILAREIEKRPQLLIAAQPTHGLDIGATEFVRATLIEQKEAGKAIILISSELDEIFSLSDRIAVLFEGKVMGILPTIATNPEQVGLLMAGIV